MITPLGQPDWQLRTDVFLTINDLPGTSVAVMNGNELLTSRLSSALQSFICQKPTGRFTCAPPRGPQHYSSIRIFGEGRPFTTRGDNMFSTKSRDEDAKQYWESAFEGATSPPLFGFAQQKPDRHSRISCPLSRDASEQLYTKADSSNVSVHAVLAAAWSLVTAAHTQDTTGAVVFLTSDVQSSGGDFPLRIDVPSSGSTTAWLVAINGSYSLGTNCSRINYDEMLSQLGSPALATKLSFRALKRQSLEMTSSEGQPNIIVDCLIDEKSRACELEMFFDSRYSDSHGRVVLDHFVHAICQVSTMPVVERCSLISQQEQQWQLTLGSPATRPAVGFVHRLFEQQVEMTPTAPAVQFESQPPMTYSELNSISNAVARQLACGRNDLIVVSIPRSTNLIVAELAILKVGAAYVPLDPDVPPSRNTFIFKDTGAPFALVSRSTRGIFERELVIEDLIASSTLIDRSNLIVPGSSEEDLAYAVYTSGSTGKPKGVLLEHRAAFTGLDAFPTLPNLRQLLFHNPVFSAAQRSIWSTLKQGGCLCLASKDNLTNTISDVLNAMRVNVIDVTPSTAGFIQPGSVPTLRRMTVAGELINPALVPLWVDELELLNAYGLSENTQFNWRRRLSRDDNPQNIGRPSDTTRAYVLVPGSIKLSPTLVPGELCLGGHQLARGYLNRPEKTAEVFIDNPFGPGRLYRTGDLAVTHADGSIEMLGRIDFSIKVNDQRVDPGEPNALLQMHPSVLDSAIVAATISSKEVLVAAVVPASPGDELELKNTLRAYLEERLPLYAIPSYFTLIDRLPLNINGKIDVSHLRKSCELLGWSGLTGRGNEHKSEYRWAPAELAIRDIIADTLAVTADQLHPDDSFLAVGGSSLEAIKLSSAALRQGFKIDTKDVLQQSTLHGIACLAQHVQEESPAVSELQLVPDDVDVKDHVMEDIYPATATQESLLMDTLTRKNRYVIRKFYRTGGIQTDRLVSALERMVQHNAILRTSFMAHASSFLQIVNKTNRSFCEIAHVDLSTYLSRNPTAGLGFKLSDPMFRATILDDYLVLEIHHALFDHWSEAMFREDLAATLQGLKLPERPLYREFIQHLRQRDKQASSKFWGLYLDSSSASWLETESPSERMCFEYSLGFDLHRATRSSNVTQSAVFYAAWAVALSQHLCKDEVVFLVTISGRDAPVKDILEMHGPTLAVVPLRVRIDKRQTFEQMAEDVASNFWNVSGHAYLGLREILRTSNVPRKLCNTAVNILTRPPSSVPANILEPLDDFEGADTDMLQIDVVAGGQPKLRVRSNQGYREAERLIENALQLLEQASLDPGQTLAHLTTQTELKVAADHNVGETERSQNPVSEESTYTPTFLNYGCATRNRSVTTIRRLGPTAYLDSQNPVRARSHLYYAAWSVLLSRHLAIASPTFSIAVEDPVRPARYHSRTIGVHLGDEATTSGLLDQTMERHYSNAFVPLYQADHSEWDTILHVVADPRVDCDQDQLVRWSDSQGMTLVVINDTADQVTVALRSKIGSKRADFILAQFETILQVLRSGEATSISEIDIVGSEEREFLVEDLGSAIHPPPRLLHSPFVEYAQTHPDSIALETTTSRLTYGQLDNLSTELAKVLRQRGVKEGDLVPLYLDKSMQTVVSIFAVLKSGAAYVPLSPDNPAERNLFVISQIGAKLLLSEAKYRSFVADIGIEAVFVDKIELESVSTTSLPMGHPNSLAYVIFTSGSTGVPKGVQISHRAVSAAMTGIICADEVDASWRTLFFYNYVFDASLHNIFPVLSCGGTLCIAPTDDLLSNLSRVVNELGIRQLAVSPTVARLLKPDMLPTVETLLCGGEQLTADIVDLWSSQRRLVNVYGPTEASIIATTNCVDATTTAASSVGIPLSTISAKIKEFGSNRLAAFGAIGELCLAGEQIADGYFGREDLDVQAFVPDIARCDQRMYRTGDRARWLDDNQLEYLGRIDHQVKVNGYRIELGEIERVILGSGMVQDCVVTVIESLQRPQIVAFCLFERSREVAFLPPEQHKDEIPRLRQALNILAHYMVPKAIVPMGRFPQQSSSKIDRNKLKRMAEETLDNTLLAAYSMEALDIDSLNEADLELDERGTFMQGLWHGLLGVPVTSLHASSNWFALGGDSIAAINLVDACRGAQFDISVGDVLENPTLGTMSSLLRPITKTRAAANPTRFELPITLEQELLELGVDRTAIEFAYRCPAGQSEWLTQGACTTQNWVVTAVRPLAHSAEQYLAVLKDLTATQEILRSTFAYLDDHGWVAAVFRDPVIDFTTISCERSERQRWIDEVKNSRFSFGLPFVKYAVLQFPDGSADIVIKASHGIWDGTSLRLMDTTILKMQANDLTREATRWSDFASYEAMSDKTSSLSFWREHSNNPPKPFPVASKPMVNESYSWDWPQKAAVDDLASAAGVTTAILFQALFQSWLAKHTASDRVAFDYLLTGRNVGVPDPQTINGPCANFLPFCVQCDPETTLQEFVMYTQKIFWKATENGNVGLEQIRHATGLPVKNNCLFLFQPFERPTGPPPTDMRWIVLALSEAHMNQPYALMEEVSRLPTGYRITFRFDNNILSMGQVEEFAQAQRATLETWLSVPAKLALGRSLRTSHA